MFEALAPVETPHLRAVVDGLTRLDPGVDDAERIDQIRVLEELKAAAAAAQARVTTAFVASQAEQQADAGLRSDEIGHGIAAQVALARRESPARARRYVGWAGVLVGELRHTFTALQRGATTEWRAMVVARETGWLSAEHRARVDAELAAGLESLGDREVEAEAKRWAYRLDPQGFVARSRGVASDRRVSVRPAPDTMCRLTGFLPVGQGVAAYAALKQHADSLRAQGDSRSRGQIMADTLVERVTGQTHAEQVPVTVNLVMTDRAMTGAGRATEADEPAHLDGYGPIPAFLARLMLRADPETDVWVRRLYAHEGRLVTMDSKARLFDAAQREFLVLRDQFCRTPWCNAPVRHADHVVGVEAGGPTSLDNGQGLCEACNLAKTAPGWRARPSPEGAGVEVVTTTPTGHGYRSRAPDVPGAPDTRVRLDVGFLELVLQPAA
jgi:hypothetical protein